SRLTSSILPHPSIPTIIQSAGVHHHMESKNLRRFLGIERSNKAKANRNTHHNERMFRKMRGRKTVLLELPDDVEQRRLDALTPNKLRTEMLKKGINPYREVQPRLWQESQVTFQSLYGVVDPYVKSEDSLPWGTNLEGLKAKGQDMLQSVQHKWHNYKSGTSRIKKKEGFEKFDTNTFGPSADLIYEEAHLALMTRNVKELHGLITEHAYAKMWPDVSEGSIMWRLVERIEPSRVVSVRVTDNPYKSGNDIAQITVRMHLKQILAVFDRFGHLMLGSETEPRTTLEYVVFENHIAVVDGKWRLHDKVYPRWVNRKEPAHFTMEIKEDDSRPSAPISLPLRAEELIKKRKNEKQKGDDDN
ncbi:mrpl-45, partial [Pristionchus pacificus]